MTHVPIAVLALTLSSMAATGCLGDPATEGTDPGTTEPEDVDTISGALTFSPGQSGSATQRGYVWTSGAPATPMVPVNNNSCFITGVFGSFTSTGDEVRIANQTVNGVATWVLTGSTGSGSPGGRAFCFHGRPSIVSGSWSQGGADVDLGSTSDRTCYLTRVKGRFDVYPWDARIRIASRSAKWTLMGSPPTPSYGLQASAACIAGAPFSSAPDTISATGSRRMVGWTGGTGNTPFGVGLMSLSGYLGGGSRIELMLVRYDDGHREWLLTETQKVDVLFGALPLSGSSIVVM